MCGLWVGAVRVTGSLDELEVGSASASPLPSPPTVPGGQLLPILRPPCCGHFPCTAPQAQYCTDWDSISWLNPSVRKDAEFVRANATVCLKNGPIPQGLVTIQQEPGAWVGGLGWVGWGGRMPTHQPACP